MPLLAALTMGFVHGPYLLLSESSALYRQPSAPGSRDITRRRQLLAMAEPPLTRRDLSDDGQISGGPVR
jgi:hypothetical protein